MSDDADDLSDETEVPEIQPDPSITPELFLSWCSPRFGASNPEMMTNPVWDWLVRSELSAYQANQRFNGPSPFDAGPGWCFQRYGKSETLLPDGRVVFVAGEHEDHYDPDFFIYNDVVVRHPNGQIEIFGYPKDVFPPTDFHSATLADDQIVIIGNLGYLETRKPGGITPVFILDLASFAITSMQTSGPSPGWVYEHTASLSEDKRTILVSHGKLDRGEGGSLVENIDDWLLHLTDWRWERLTERRWLRWEVLRADGKRNHIWEIQQAAWSRSVGWHKELAKQLEQLEADLGIRPTLDLLETLFRPPIAHDLIAPVEDEYSVFRIRIAGVVVRYVFDMYSIQITVEGDLDQPSVAAVTSDFIEKLSALENANIALKQI